LSTLKHTSSSAVVSPQSGLLAETALPAAIDAPCRYVELPQAGRIAYYTNGMDGGRPVVLLHSVNAAPSAREMRPLFEHYRKVRPVYAPDLPGFGRSERSDRDYSPTLYADFIKHFLRDVVATPADIVAFSLSAEFAARALNETSELCRSLVLISPTGFGQRQPPSGPPTDRILKALRLPVLGGGLFKLLTSRLSIRHFLGLSFAGKPPVDLVDYAYATAHQPGARHAPFRFLSMKLFTPEADRQLFELLRVPVLVLFDRDPNVSFERLDAFASKDNWHIHRISPTRGLPHWERTEQTVEALDAFWASVGLRNCIDATRD
jgi:pimeloyl-ACP methyl ester carboxylesterase